LEVLLNSFELADAGNFEMYGLREDIFDADIVHGGSQQDVLVEQQCSYHGKRVLMLLLDEYTFEDSGDCPFRLLDLVFYIFDVETEILEPPLLDRGEQMLGRGRVPDSLCHSKCI
jgi:hypothetical protein